MGSNEYLSAIWAVGQIIQDYDTYVTVFLIKTQLKVWIWPQKQCLVKSHSFLFTYPQLQDVSCTWIWGSTLSWLEGEKKRP